MRYTWLIALISLARVVSATAQDLTQPQGVQQFDVVSIKPCDPEKAGSPEGFLELLATTPPSHRTATIRRA